MFDTEKITCMAPVGLTDYGLAEALIERFEASPWHETGQFLGEVFLRVSAGGKEEIERILDNLPTVTNHLRMVLTEYYAVNHGDATWK